tara:strand:+ start:375 stop:1034 length:660 start_codon:yes stop_codon:yes gene_type:complete
MLNLAEMLVVVIGFLLALLFVDGVRRSLKTKKNKSSLDNLPNLYLEQEGLDELVQNSTNESCNSALLSQDDQENQEQQISDISKHNLLIINLSHKELEPFSFRSLSEQLLSYSFFFEEKGYFTFRDLNDSVLLSLVNAKIPGTFLEDLCSSDIALVLDPNRTENLVEAFDLMSSLARTLSEVFSCSLLDENRNLLTKQMLEHMRNETQEYQRQHLVKVS